MKPWVRVRILFEWRDLWVGLYVKEPYVEMGCWVHTYFVCVLPMLPIRIEIGKPMAEHWRDK